MEHLVVAGLALFDLWAALPPALILKTEPLLTAGLVALSSSLGVLLTIALCAAFRDWLMRRIGRDGYIGARTDRFMAKYGTPGLGLLSPLILGPVLTCAGAVALGARTRQLAAWAVAGVCLWSVAFYGVLASDLGAKLFGAH
jgi:hypothetical protein